MFLVRLRLKSVSNIKKITSSMKMVSAAKYARAERDLKAAKPYGEGAAGTYRIINTLNCFIAEEPHLVIAFEDVCIQILFVVNPFFNCGDICKCLQSHLYSTNLYQVMSQVRINNTVQ